MNFTIFQSKDDFTPVQQKELSLLGQVIFCKNNDEIPMAKLLEMAKDADIIGAGPSSFGGFEKAKPNLMKVLEASSKLKGICLGTTSFGWIDLDWCKKHNIPVSNIPGYSRESVAEHAIAMLLCLAKRILVLDRKTQKGTFELQMGIELKGKTLGVIGLGSIGSRIAELGQGIGMKVIAYNRHPKKFKGVITKSFDRVLKESDAIALSTTHEDTNRNMISDVELNKMKKGVFIVNIVDRDLVNEKAMAQAIKSGKVGGYCYEGEDLVHTPLAKLENAVGIKAFAWFTKESLENLFQIWVSNLVAFAKGKSQNRIA